MMNDIEIKRGDAIVFTIPIDETFIYREMLMGEKSISGTLRIVDAVKLKAGDYFDYQGERYTLFDEPQFRRSEGIYAYEITFYAPYYCMHHVLMKDEGATIFRISAGYQII